MAAAEKKVEKEGANLLGQPKFSELPNGRLKCVETGHELFEKDRESYSQCKRCRLGLIDYALSNKKPPLNMFTQDPDSRSKLLCKLTGDKINKSEEHIWKHINGKRFLNKLEKEEEEKLGQMDWEDEVGEEIPEKVGKREKAKKKGKQKGKEKGVMGDESAHGEEENPELEDADFWMPPVGERWDFDDGGGDRWGSDAESGDQTAEEEAAFDGPQESDNRRSEETPHRSQKRSASIEIETNVSVVKKRKKKTKNSINS